jgi:hypothetical protein
MDKTLAAERLRALALDDACRPMAARLRDVIDDVEAALAAGVPRVRVLEELRALGLNMSLATFETTLRRIRAKGHKRRGAALSSPDSRAVPSMAMTPPAADAAHRPSQLDQIIGSTPDLAALARIGKRRSAQ